MMCNEASLFANNSTWAGNSLKSDSASKLTPSVW